MPDDWINPNNLLMFIGEPTENAIVDINTDYISRLSNYLTNYDDELENIDWLENTTFIDFEPDRKKDDKLYTCPLKVELLDWIQD